MLKRTEHYKYRVKGIRTLLNNQVTKYKHDRMTAVNVVPAISVLAIYRQAEARDELQNPFRNKKRTGVVCFRAAEIRFTGYR